MFPLPASAPEAPTEAATLRQLLVKRDTRLLPGYVITRTDDGKQLALSADELRAVVQAAGDDFGIIAQPWTDQG